MQIPVGILLDRFGARRMLAVGGLIMAIGQLTVGLSSTLLPAVIGRIFVGAGDAFTFISMIRMVNNWITGKRASVVQQWLSTIGQLGQIVSAFPFVFLLELTGWQSSFISLAALSLFGVALTLFFGAENPEHRDVAPPKIGDVISKLWVNARRHPVLMGFWTHFSTQSMGNIFALLWGVPFLVGAEGMARAEASLVITVFVITNASLGPIIGAIAFRYPHWQARMIVIIPVAAMAAWLVVLFWPSPAPHWLLFALAITLGVGGPTSMLAFDYTRVHVKREELGAANGFVNIGGFLAGFIMMGLIGVGLDIANGDGPLSSLYSAGNFRQVLWVQFVVVGIGLVAFVYENRQTKKLESIRVS
jgi:MFS family permease